MNCKTSRDYVFSPEDGMPNGPACLTRDNPARTRYAKPQQLLQNPDAIVIGSGIGGLGIASILAQKKGWKVLLLEACAVPGGATRCHEVDGFEFPSGIDSIGDMDPTVGRGLYRPTIDYLTKGQLKWAKMPDVHEICRFGETDYAWYSSPDKNIEWGERDFPNQGDVRRYYHLEASVEWSAWAWAATKLLPTWIPLVVRSAFYRLFGGHWRAFMLRNTTDVFTKVLGFSAKLASVFSYMYGNHGRTPLHAPFAFHAVNLIHYRDGAYYPVGGPAQIANCIIPIIEAVGGQLAVSSVVKRILVEENTAVGVELEDGQTIRAPLLISDASAYTTFMKLLDPEVSERHGYPKRFGEIGPSPGHVYLLLGYGEPIELPKQIFWQMPNYEGIPAYDLDAADHHYKQNMALEGMGGYLLSPSARDPIHQQRYPNQATVVVLAEAPYAWAERCKTDPVFKEQFLSRLADNLERIAHQHMPQLRGKTATVRQAGVSMGCNPFAWNNCSLGLEPSGDRFVRHTHWLRPKTEIRNLYLTGQDSFSAGFAGSMLSSRLCYSAITGNWWFMLKKNP